MTQGHLVGAATSLAVATVKVPWRRRQPVIRWEGEEMWTCNLVQKERERNRIGGWTKRFNDEDARRRRRRGGVGRTGGVVAWREKIVKQMSGGSWASRGREWSGAKVVSLCQNGIRRLTNVAMQNIWAAVKVGTDLEICIQRSHAWEHMLCRVKFPRPQTIVFTSKLNFIPCLPVTWRHFQYPIANFAHSILHDHRYVTGTTTDECHTDCYACQMKLRGVWSRRPALHLLCAMRQKQTLRH
jgi:hypothetical protein